MSNIITSQKLRDATQIILDTYETTLLEVTPATAEMVGLDSISTPAFIHAFGIKSTKAKRWVGPKEIGTVSLGSIPGQTETFYDALAISTNDFFANNAASQIARNTIEFTKNKARFIDERVAELLDDGDVQSTGAFANYDGKGVFDASRSIDGPSTQSNLFFDRPLTAANLELSYMDFLSMKDSSGATLNKAPRWLVVPPTMYLTAKKLVDLLLVNGGESNVFYGNLEVVSLPALSRSDAWFLISDEGGKPFTNHEFMAPGFVVTDSPTDYSRLYEDRVEFHWEARCSVMAGPYQLLQKNYITETRE